MSSHPHNPSFPASGLASIFLLTVSCYGPLKTLLSHLFSSLAIGLCIRPSSYLRAASSLPITFDLANVFDCLCLISLYWLADFWTVSEFPLVPKISESWYDYLVAAGWIGFPLNCLSLTFFYITSIDAGYDPLS